MRLFLISLLVAVAFCPEDQVQTEGGLVRGLVSDGYRAFKVNNFVKHSFELNEYKKIFEFCFFNGNSGSSFIYIKY